MCKTSIDNAPEIVKSELYDIRISQYLFTYLFIYLFIFGAIMKMDDICHLSLNETGFRINITKSYSVC